MTDLVAVRCARPGDLAGKKAPAGTIAANASTTTIMVVVNPTPIDGCARSTSSAPTYR